MIPLQSRGRPASQAPAAVQASPTVQYRPSSHEVPARSGLDTALHASTSSSHTAVWQLPTTVPAHERAAPGTHWPLAEQVSPAVQNAPSSQVPPTLRTKHPSQQSLMPLRRASAGVNRGLAL